MSTVGGAACGQCYIFPEEIPGDAFPNQDSESDVMASFVGHEIAEIISDPGPGYGWWVGNMCPLKFQLYFMPSLMH